jgi:RNA polymerase sigma factor (sigma-70 family)
MSLRVRLPNPLAALDDRALLARFADQRDEPAFEQLVKRHGALVYGVCKRAVRDRHLAEDAFQAVFLVLARHPQRAVEAASVGGWLFGVARRVGLAARRHELRREKRAGRAGGASPLMDTEQPSSPQADFDDVLRVLDEELAAMPEEPRAALVACFLQERTQDEAAHELGWSLSTLRRRLDRGKELLRARLARRGVALAVSLLTGAVASPARAAVPPLAASPSTTAAALAGEALARGTSAKLLAAVACAALATCGLALGLANEPPAKAEAPAPALVKAAPAPEVAPAPRAVDAKRWVTVTGRIVLAEGRAVPKPRLVTAENIKDADEWRPFAPLRYEETLVHADNRGVANVVVFLRPDSDDRAAAIPAEAVHPDFAKAKPAERTVFASAGQFAPRVLAARAGDTVTFTNRLPVPTNVFYDAAQGGAGREFNVLVGKGMSHTAKPLVTTRIPDLYRSSIYPWMKGVVWGFDHPYFAVTDANGHFEMRNVPAGKWRVVAWHEVAGWRCTALGTKIAIPEGGKHELPPLEFDSLE